jgi:hypothetical protein
MLVEGDGTQYEYLARHFPVPAAWSLRREVVAATTGTATFYRASNAAESGLIDPERLRPVWPNLGTSRILEEQPAVSLQDLLGESGKETNWLLLDCLPATPLLRGAGEALGKLDLILVRVTLDDERVAGLDSGLEELRSWLHEQGFRYLTMQAERHPALAHALFVRDVAQLQAAIDIQRCELDALRGGGSANKFIGGPD